MTTTPDPKIVRELAEEVANIALHDAVHVDRWISTVVNSRFGNECSQFRAPLHIAVTRRMAVVKPSWPDEQPRDERDARIAELEREVRQLRAGAPRAWKTDWHDPISRFETFVNVTRNYDSDHLGGIMRGGSAEATITLGDLRAVLARLAELEAHPWIVVHPAQEERNGIDATRLAQIRDRSQRLAEISFDHHDDANYIITDLIDSAADVKWLIKQLDQTRIDTAPQQPEDGGDPR